VLNLFTQPQSVLKANLLKLADKVANKYRKPKSQPGGSREDIAKADNHTVIREWFSLCSAHIRTSKETVEAARRVAQAVGTPSQTGRAKVDPHAKTDSPTMKTPAHQVKKNMAAPMINSSHSQQEVEQLSDEFEGLSPMTGLSPTPANPRHPNPKNGPQELKTPLRAGESCVNTLPSTMRATTARKNARLHMVTIPGALELPTMRF